MSAALATKLYPRVIAGIVMVPCRRHMRWLVASHYSTPGGQEEKKEI